MPAHIHLPETKLIGKDQRFAILAQQLPSAIARRMNRLGEETASHGSLVSTDRPIFRRAQNPTFSSCRPRGIPLPT